MVTIANLLSNTLKTIELRRLITISSIVRGVVFINFHAVMLRFFFQSLNLLIAKKKICNEKITALKLKKYYSVKKVILKMIIFSDVIKINAFTTTSVIPHIPNI